MNISNHGGEVGLFLNGTFVTSNDDTAGIQKIAKSLAAGLDTEVHSVEHVSPSEDINWDTVAESVFNEGRIIALDTPLTVIQNQVALHYEAGDFDYIKTVEEARNVGDGLFTFLVHEAGDAENFVEFVGMLARAAGQINDLTDEMDKIADIERENAALLKRVTDNGNNPASPSDLSF